MGLPTTLLGLLTGGVGDIINYAQWQQLQQQINADQGRVESNIASSNEDARTSLAKIYQDQRNENASNYATRMNTWDTDTKSIDTRLGNLESDTVKGYADRYARGMGYIKGQGDAERQLISKNAAAGRSTQAAGFANRGLAGTGIVAANDQASRSQEALDLGLSQDRTNQLYLNTDASLSGDQLSAAERLGKYRADTIASRLAGREGLQDEALQTQQDLEKEGGLADVGQQVAGSTRFTNAVQSRQYMSPVNNPAQSIGAGISQIGAADTYAKTMRTPWWRSAVPGAVSAGGRFGAAALLGGAGGAGAAGGGGYASLAALGAL